MCGYSLAEVGSDQQIDFIAFITPHFYVLEALKFDCLDTLYNRLVGC